MATVFGYRCQAATTLFIFLITMAEDFAPDAIGATDGSLWTPTPNFQCFSVAFVPGACDGTGMVADPGSRGDGLGAALL